MQRVKELLYAIAIALFYGAFEAYIYDHGFISSHELWQFSYYHLGMALILLAMIRALKTSFYYFPLVILFEDIFFWIFSERVLTQDSWVCNILGSWQIKSFIIPGAYIILLALFFALYKLSLMSRKGR